MVTLRTSLVREPPAGLGPVAAGFGGLVLERSLLRERAVADADHPNLLTGRSPAAHGVVDFRSCWLADEIETLAEALQDVGYTTACFSGNPLVSRERNFDQGFNVFETSAQAVKSDQVVPLRH